MSQSVIHAVFLNNTSAQKALEVLSEEGFTPGHVSVIGNDSDEFRAAAATLHSTKVDKLMIGLGIAGAAMGTVIGAWAVQFLPGFDATYITMVTLTSAFSGLALGLIVGLATGAIVRLDRMPPYEANVRLGDVHDGDLAVSVSVQTAAERALVHSLFEQSGAKHIAVDIIDSEIVPMSKSTTNQILSKIA